MPIALRARRQRAEHHCHDERRHHRQKNGTREIQRADQDNDEDADGRRLGGGAPKARNFRYRLWIADCERKTRRTGAADLIGLFRTPLRRLGAGLFHGLDNG